MAILGDVLSCSDGDGTGEHSVLQQDTEDQEHKVEQEHGEAQQAAHPPAARGDGRHDEEEHEEEQHDGAEQAVGADFDRLPVVQQSVYEPRDRQT